MKGWMKMFIWVALVMSTAMLLSCAGVSKLPSGYLTSETQILHRVSSSREYISYIRWQGSPWFRIGDGYTIPIFLLVDQNGYACVVPASIWGMQPTYIACPTGWRVKRGDEQRRYR